MMRSDVNMAARCGAEGLVVGALLPDGSIDTDTCLRLADAARSHGLSLTFHRAFDRVADAFGSLECIIAMGFDRVLTSGLAPTALEGAAMRNCATQRLPRITRFGTERTTVGHDILALRGGDGKQRQRHAPHHRCCRGA